MYHLIKQTVGLLCGGLLFWFFFLSPTSLHRHLGLVHCLLCYVQHPSWLLQALQRLMWGSFISCTGWVSSVGTSAKNFWRSPWQTWFPFEASEFSRKLFSSLAQERSVCYWGMGESCQQKYLCLTSIYLFIFCPSPCLPVFLKPPTLANQEIHSTAVQPSVKGLFLLCSPKITFFLHCQESGLQI